MPQTRQSLRNQLSLLRIQIKARPRPGGFAQTAFRGIELRKSRGGFCGDAEIVVALRTAERAEHFPSASREFRIHLERLKRWNRLVGNREHRRGNWLPRKLRHGGIEIIALAFPTKQHFREPFGFQLRADVRQRRRQTALVPERLVRAIDPARRIAILDDQSEMAFDLFLGVPTHRAPAVVEASGMTEGGWIAVNPKNLKTRFPGVYAIGDVTSVGTPKAGVFAEGAARVVAASVIAELQGTEEPSPYTGAGACYVEFGANRVGRVDVDFLSGPSPTGDFLDPSAALVGEKQIGRASCRERVLVQG